MSSQVDLRLGEDDTGAARPRRRGSALTTVGVLLLVTGLACLGWVGWQYLGTSVVAERTFRGTAEELRTAWERPATERDEPATGQPAPGEPLALLRIPAFGADYQVPILSGTDLDVLEDGVGHYPSTADPGETGNFAVAGHRVTHGEPFARLLELEAGDQVVVETRQAVHTYVVDEPARNLTVADTATWVLDPVPGEPNAEPSQALITLTTCQDLFRSPDRSVAFGHLQDTRNKE